VETLAVKDYYRLLGVEKDAAGEEIRKAYRKERLQAMEAEFLTDR
jgi:DnaJ-class molecular chaperone